MNIARWSLPCVALALFCGTFPAVDRHAPNASEIAPAQASAPQETSGEGDVSLFVQDPHLKSGKKAISLAWIPEPLQKYCLGKTLEACATIDYCFRTTNKDAARCQNLGVDTQHFSPYRPDTTPRRLLVVDLLYPMTPDHGRGNLMHFFEAAPQGSLDRLDARAQIKARVKLTRTSDDDQFQLLEVLSVPSS
jgi:hypothetical protein